MTVASEVRTVSYVGDGVITDYPYEWYIINAADMAVYLDDVLQTTGYSVTGAGSPSGGTVVFSTPPALGVDISIQRNVEYTQEVDLIPYDRFPAQSVEASLDRVVMMAQQLRDTKSDKGHQHTAADITDLAAYLVEIAANVGYAEEWANKAEDSLISADAGGDEIDDYSALHHANKSSDSADASAAWASTASGHASTAGSHATSASNSKDYAAEWANKAEDSLISAAAGGDEVDDYSALHWANKAASFGGTNYIRKDGTTALTANWDAGAFKITAQQLESDVATGTAPLVVASTTKVANLNADMVDGIEAAAMAQKAVANEFTKPQWHDLTGMTFDATQDWDWSLHANAVITLTGNTTFDAPTNSADGQICTVTLIQNATGGHAVAWNAVYFFDDIGVPVMPTTASSGIMIISFERVSSTAFLEVGRRLFNA